MTVRNETDIQQWQIEIEDAKNDSRISDVLHATSTQTKCGGWHAHNFQFGTRLEMHQRSDGKFGHSLEKTQQNVITNILRIQKTNQ